MDDFYSMSGKFIPLWCDTRARSTLEWDRAREASRDAWERARRGGRE